MELGLYQLTRATAMLAILTASFTGVATAQGRERAVGSVELVDGSLDVAANDSREVVVVGHGLRTITVRVSSDSMRHWLDGPARDRSLIWVLGWHGRLQSADRLTVRSSLLGKPTVPGTLEVERQLFSSGSICYLLMSDNDSTKGIRIMALASQMLRVKGLLLQAASTADSLSKEKVH